MSLDPRRIFDGGDPLSRRSSARTGRATVATTGDARSAPPASGPRRATASGRTRRTPTRRPPATTPPAAQAHAAFLAQRRFASLDGLRCLAILEVIWRHASGRRVDPFGRGVGVDLSFAISGFLITTLLTREFRKTGRIDVRRFYGRRTLRIFPLYFAVLGLYVALVLATRSGTSQGTAFLHHLPAFATYTSNWFVPLGNASSNIFFFSWSLATQEQFYLLWPLALVLFLAPGRWWRAGAVMAAALVVDQVALHATSGHDLALTIVRSIGTPICLGALWALAFQSPGGFAVSRRLLGHRAAAPALLAILVACFIAPAPFEVLELLLAAIVAACCIREDNLAAPLLTSRPLVFVGQVSYGMYLFHMLAVNAVRPLVGHGYGLGVFLPATALTIIVAQMSYRWFETPILRYRDRNRRRSGSPVLAPVPAAGSEPVPVPASSRA